MKKQQKCKYIGAGWSHLKNKIGYVSFKYFDTSKRTDHVYYFTPKKDVFSTSNNSYVVYPKDIEFIEET